MKIIFHLRERSQHHNHFLAINVGVTYVLAGGIGLHALFAAIFAWLAFIIRKGKKWRQIVTSVLLILYVLLTIYTWMAANAALDVLPAESPYILAGRAILTALAFVVLALLWLPIHLKYR